MLYDSAYLQERDIEYVNKKHQKKHEPPVEQLYDVVDVTNAMAQFISINYEQCVQVAGGVTLTFLDAGHILGSAVTLLELEEHGKRKRIGFTGDLGRKNAPIIKDPQQIGSVDVLISERTYGKNSLSGNRHERLVMLCHSENFRPRRQGDRSLLQCGADAGNRLSVIRTL